MMNHLDKYLVIAEDFDVTVRKWKSPASHESLKIFISGITRDDC